MRRWLYLLAGAAALMVGHGAMAQSLDSYKQHLSRATETGAVVTTTEHGDAAAALRQAARAGQRTTVKGFRVCIFFDNGPDARSKAFEAKRLFEEHYADVNVYPVYDSPWWSVTVGDCFTKEEAIILKGRIAPLFPEAYPKNEEIPVTVLTEVKEPQPTVIQTQTEE